MICIPMSYGLMGVIVELDSNLGKLRVIDTRSTLNCIRSSFLHEKGLSENLTSITYQYRDQPLGSSYFYFYELTPILSDIDGILGTNFLDENVLYLDFEKGYAYIQPNKNCSHL